MLFEFTSMNLVTLMHNIPFVDEDQLLDFFSDEMDFTNLGNLIDYLIMDERLQRVQMHEGKYEVLKEKGGDYYSDLEVAELLFGFWVLVNMGSTNVNFVFSPYGGHSPVKYCLLDNNNEVIDITVCGSEEAARVGTLTRTEEKDDGIHKRHIALVLSPAEGEKMAKALKDYDYDMYCYLDPDDHTATYVTLK